MNIGVNQFCFPMTYDVKDAVLAARRLGFDSIEVCLTAADAARPGGGVTDALDISSYHNRLLNIHSTAEEVRELGQIARDAGIRIGSVGGIVSFSIYPLTARDPAVAEKAWMPSSECWTRRMCSAQKRAGHRRHADARHAL